MVEHCAKALPDEGCGLFAVAEGTVTAVFPTDNLDRSPVGYTVPPQQHHDALVAAEMNGWEIGGTFHSHPSGRAVPSRRDVKGALDPDWIHLILELGDDAVIRAWRIRGGRAREVILR